MKLISPKINALFHQKITILLQILYSRHFGLPDYSKISTPNA